MTTAQVVETSVTVNNNSPIQEYVHPDDQTRPTFEMTPGFKPFTQIHCTNQNTMCNLDHYVHKVYKQQTYVFHVHERFGHVFEHPFYFP